MIQWQCSSPLNFNLYFHPDWLCISSSIQKAVDSRNISTAILSLYAAHINDLQTSSCIQTCLLFCLNAPITFWQFTNQHHCLIYPYLFHPIKHTLTLKQPLISHNHLPIMTTLTFFLTNQKASFFMSRYTCESTSNPCKLLASPCSLINNPPYDT